MDSYSRLIHSLHNANFLGEGVEDTDLKKDFDNSNFLNLLIYNYKIKIDQLKLISPRYNFKKLNYSDLGEFLQVIKPCFKIYFTDYFSLFIQFLTENTNKELDSKFTLQLFLPFKNKKGKYIFDALYIFPEILDNKIIELYFIILPLKVYKGEVITINILKNFKKDNYITSKIRNKIQLENVLTKEQIKIADLLHIGYSSKEIAIKLEKKLDNILKYNIRIKERLSSFFDTDFSSAKIAVDYYKNFFS